MVISGAAILRTSTLLLFASTLLACSGEPVAAPSDPSEHPPPPVGGSASAPQRGLEDDRYLQIWLAANTLVPGAEQPQPSQPPTDEQLGDVTREAYDAHREQLRADQERAKPLLRKVLDRQELLVGTFWKEHGLLRDAGCSTHLRSAVLAFQLGAVDAVEFPTGKEGSLRDHTARALVLCGALTCEQAGVEPCDWQTAQSRDAGAGAAPDSASEGPQGSVLVGGVGVTGGTVSDASAVVATMRGRLRYCYRAGLRSNPELQGQVVLTVELAPDGLVRGVTHPVGDPLDAILGCVKAVVYGAQFAPPKGGSATLTIPITFVREL